MLLNKTTKKYLNNKVSGYVSKDQGTREFAGFLRLDLGENLLGSAHVQGLKILKRDLIGYYADPSNLSVKKKIASLYKLSDTNVLVANSSNEIIDYIPKMILGPGDKSLFLVPTFYRFIDSVAQVDGSSIMVNSQGPSLEEIVEEVINKSNLYEVKIIWLCSPNNPTGEILDLASIEKIVKSTPSLVIVDEAFFEFYDPSNKKSASTLVNKYENVIVLRTLSKAYGLAGLRFGYALSHPKTIKTIEDYRDTLLMTSKLIVQMAAQALSDQAFIKRTAKEIAELRHDTFEKISKLENLELGANSVTNVYLLRHQKKDLYEELLKRKIKTADFRNSQGIEKKNYARVTIGTKEQNEKLLKALKEIN